MRVQHQIKCTVWLLNGQNLEGAAQHLPKSSSSLLRLRMGKQKQEKNQAYFGSHQISFKSYFACTLNLDGAGLCPANEE